MNLEDIYPAMRVAYIPRHARGDIDHPDVERGWVKSVRADNVFVVFDFENKPTNGTAKACDPDFLVAI